MSLPRFLDRLAAPTYAPGGGSAAALTGAVGAALLEMVIALNNRREKKKKGRIDGAALKRLKAVSSLRCRLLELVEEDAKAFTRAMKHSGNQRLIKACAKVPLEIAEKASKLMTFAAKEKTRTNAWLRGDLKGSVILALAAARSAKLAVEANFSQITDKRFVSALKKRIGRDR